MPLNAELLRSLKDKPANISYGHREAILYAVGVGASIGDPLADSTLQYTSPRFLKALPTLACGLGTPSAFMEMDVGITWPMVVHGEQHLRIHQPLPPSGTFTTDSSLAGIWDKGPGRGALMATNRSLRDPQTGALYAETTSVLFLRADGGFGGSNDGAPQPPAVPDRAPDLTVDMPTRPDQAMIYQLMGDYNPLHVDPGFARKVGFERPILHGLCAYGVGCRGVLRLLCGDDPGRLRQFNVRFSKPMFPGETLRVEIWHQGSGKAAYRARVVDRDAIVQDSGVVNYV